MVQVGDKIRFLDSVGGGKVVRVDAARKLVYVETEDGFEIPTAESQCVVIALHEVRSMTTTRASSQDAVAAKQKTDDSGIPARLLRANGKKQARQENLVEIDLHIEKLVRAWQDMQPVEILNYQLTIFRKTMREQMRYRGRKLVFIHGKGKGVLKTAICQTLEREFPQCTYHDASFAQYEFGAIMVQIP